MDFSKLRMDDKKPYVAAAVIVATAVAGYTLYKTYGQSENKTGDKVVKSKNGGKVKMEENNIAMAKYYGGEEEFKWFSIINRSDYTGCGLFTEEVDEVDPETGRKYRRGNSLDDDAPYLMRDERMWDLIKTNMPKNRKIRIIELGSGRGSSARYLAKKLLEMNKLEIMVCTNIGEFENEYNRSMASKAGIPENKYKVQLGNFDDLSEFQDGSYDVIFSNDALYHSHDHPKLAREMARMCSKGGVVCFTDYLVCQGVPEAKMPVIKDRFHLKTVPSLQTYDVALQGAGMKKILLEGDEGETFTRHFGYQLYTLTVLKKTALERDCSKKYLDNKRELIHSWLDMADQKLMEEGWLCYKKD